MHQIDLILFDGFPLLSLSMMTEPIRIANRESLRPVFTWRILSEDGEKVSSSSGIPVAADAGFSTPAVPALAGAIVLTSYGADKTRTPAALAYLKALAKRDMLLGCVDTGAYLFASAGLLKNHPAAVHHEAIAGLQNLFPGDMFVDKLFDFNARRCSSSGGVATLDMTLALIAHFEGRALASRVAETLNYLPLASDRAQGAFGPDWALRRLDPKLADAIAIMTDNIDTPLSIPQIARKSGLPVWKLQRLFQKYYGESPTRHYLGRRLDRGRALLRNSPAKVGDISIQCGFGNFESFSRAYRNRFGQTPSSDREY